MSLRNQILNYCKAHPFEWVNGGVFETLAGQLGFKASNASRRLRELENAGILEVRYNSKHCAEYRYKRILEQVPPQPRQSQQAMI